MKVFFYLLFLLFELNCLGQNHPVEMKDGYFYLNGKKTFLKGLGMEIVRPGQKLDSEASHSPEWFIPKLEFIYFG